MDPPDRENVPLSHWLQALATLAFLGLALASAGSRSATPVVLGRYSAASFAYQLFNGAILALLALPPRGSGWRQAGWLLVAASTFLALGNESNRHLPGIKLALPSIRLLAGLALVAGEFDRFRAGRKAVRGFLLGAGVTLGLLSVLDLLLWVWVGRTPAFEEDFEGYRDRYSLAEITTDDIVLVGDSFVWGHGVGKAERFGDVLERQYAGEGRSVRVFSLGVRGAGPARYLESLDRVPTGNKAGLVIFAFYPNDLAPRPRPAARLVRLLQGVTWPLGRSSLAIRAVHDLLGKFETPSLAAFHRDLIDDYRRDDPTFPARWAALAGALDQFARRASARSSRRPLLLIIPLMVDYRDYPLEEAHRNLRAAAEPLGYDVLDLLPAFRATLHNGDAYRVSRQDNHFDARVHTLVASLIKQHLDARPDTSKLGLPVAPRQGGLPLRLR